VKAIVKISCQSSDLAQILAAEFAALCERYDLEVSGEVLGEGFDGLEDLDFPTVNHIEFETEELP
jgi:hypothetical protein